MANKQYWPRGPGVAIAASGSGGAANTDQSWAASVIPDFDHQSGDTGAFTRNSDGTVTVRDDGWYTITANVKTSGGTTGNRRIFNLQTGTTNNAANNLASVGASPGNPDSSWGDAVLAYVGYLPAGTVLKVWIYTDEVGVTRKVQKFGIASLAP